MPLELVDINCFLLAFLILLVAAKIGGEAAERLGQPSVLGEILAGIIVGTTGFGLIGHTELAGVEAFRVLWLDTASHALPAQATYQALNALAEIGVIVLLFEIGLHSDLYELRKVGKSALWVGVAGVILPMIGGYFVSRYLLHFDHFTALFIGAALTATSVGITARVFQDMKLLHTAESQVVLGAAVADDVIGLVVLAVVVALAPNKGIDAAEAVNPLWQGIKVTVTSLGFLATALLVGVKCVPLLDKVMSGAKSRGGLTIVSLAFCLGIALLGQIAGLAMIVGAFTAGLVLSHSDVKAKIQESISPIADIFIPIFFALTGCSLNLRILGQGTELFIVAGALIVVAVAGKVIGCMTVPDKNLSKAVVGLGMIPRGEVGLIYARMGIQKGWLSGAGADGLILMVMATTLMTPPLLRNAVLKLKKERGEEISPEMEQSFPPSENGLERENWEIFQVDDMLQDKGETPPKP